MKSAGSGPWWRRTSSSIRSPFRAAQKCWCSYSGQSSPVSFAATVIPVTSNTTKAKGSFAGRTSNAISSAYRKSPKRRTPRGFAATRWHCVHFCFACGTGSGPDVRYGPVTRQELILKSVPLEKQFFALANRYLDSDDKDVRNLATALLLNFERFFTFLEKDGVEPTNNSAERALRCAVQWRKTSFGSRSAGGEVAVARLLTVTRTCRMQGRHPLVHIAASLRSHRTAQTAPSLLKPASTT